MPRKQMPAAELAAKKELALEVIERLKAEYPDAACTLDYADAWQLLVSVRLAAQCTDARVNVVVEELFAKYPGVAALAAAEPEDIEAIVKPCGLGHSNDTHCIRLCNRIGLVDNVKEPQKVEMLLWQIIPPEEGSDLCHRFVLHGRAVCDARKPACEKCCLAHICRTAREAKAAAQTASV